jgi:hypothetical protein
MEDFNDLTQQWKKGRSGENIPDPKEIILLAKQKKQHSIQAHIGTIGILTTTLIVLSLFFIYVAPFRETISHTGIILMLGGLFIRVVIEIVSMRKAAVIAPDQTTIEHTNRMIGFYEFRKKIHGPLTYIIFGLYGVGFFLLIPEFSLYISESWMIIMVISFLVIMTGLLIIIWKSTRRELRILKELVTLKSALD